jgi:hypothetical protein
MMPAYRLPWWPAGYDEDPSVVIENRWAENKLGRLHELAGEFVRGQAVSDRPCWAVGLVSQLPELALARSVNAACAGPA